jgi:protein-tyrosine phosphatase
MVRELQEYRAYGPDERPIYLKIRMLKQFRFSKPQRPEVAMARSVLFVCFGNIMRSPMCEALMNRALTSLGNRELIVKSAGLNAVPGTPAHPWAVEAAKDFGISLEGHRAQSLTSEMVSRADVIFAMDYQNHVRLLSRWVTPKKTICMLSAYAGPDYLSAEIRDPYYLDLEGTRICYRTLNSCIQNLARAISETTQADVPGPL